MEKLKLLLPKPIGTARWLAFLAVTAAAAIVAWKVITIWRSTFGTLPDVDPANLGVTSPWHPFFTFLLACILCVLGAMPMLRERRNLSLPRAVSELIYFIFAMYLLYKLSDVLYFMFATGHSGPAL